MGGFVTFNGAASVFLYFHGPRPFCWGTKSHPYSLFRGCAMVGSPASLKWVCAVSFQKAGRWKSGVWCPWRWSVWWALSLHSTVLINAMVAMVGSLSAFGQLPMKFLLGPTSVCGGKPEMSGSSVKAARRRPAGRKKKKRMEKGKRREKWEKRAEGHRRKRKVAEPGSRLNCSRGCRVLPIISVHLM